MLCYWRSDRCLKVGWEGTRDSRCSRIRQLYCTGMIGSIPRNWLVLAAFVWKREKEEPLTCLESLIGDNNDPSSLSENQLKFKVKLDFELKEKLVSSSRDKITRTYSLIFWMRDTLAVIQVFCIWIKWLKNKSISRNESLKFTFNREKANF